MATETKEQNWFRKHWIISIILGLIVLGMFSSIFNSENNSDMTGNVVNEQINNKNFNEIELVSDRLMTFPEQVKKSISESTSFNYWNSVNQGKKLIFIHYNESNYKSLLDMLELENLKSKFEERCGNELIPEEMIVSNEEGIAIHIRTSDGKIMCDTILTESPKEDVKTCTPNWNCNSWSECSSSGIQKRTCTDANNCNVLTNKPKESQSCEYKKTSTEESSSDGWTSDLKDSLEELQKGLDIYKKKQLCAELCAGEYADIPAVKGECLLSCSEIYYYTGEEGLDKYLAELQE